MNEHNKPQTGKKDAFVLFLLKRIVIAVIFIAVVIFVVMTGTNYLKKPGPWKDRRVEGHVKNQDAEKTDSAPPLFEPPRKAASNTHTPKKSEATAQGSTHGIDASNNRHEKPVTQTTRHNPEMPSHQQPAQKVPSTPQLSPHTAKGAKGSHAVQTEQSQAATPHMPLGVAFVEAVITPMDYELNHRFWGWRPNDIINFTDNVNQFQLGVLEVTRRAVVQLADRISRTGTTDAFNHNLESAVNWLMVKADSYWFPSPEKKYKESLEELEAYKNNLMIGEASFYKRADNLIPLLASFEDLLGSCDENLVKTKEKDGSEVGFLKADNYFYYAKGVANTMAVILKAVHHDFETTVDNRNGAELLHHAILSCELAASLDPLFVTNGSLDGILANHRAHMAAPISHARYYIGQLIKTLST